jgi:biotin carboxylase
MGLDILGVDGDPNAVGANDCTEFLAADISDRAAIVQVARSRKIRAVLPSPIGRLLATVGAVNTALNLRGVSLTAAQTCVDKALFDRQMRLHGVRRPWQIRVGQANRLPAVLFSMDEPCIVKPAEGSGSRGVYVVRDRDDVDAALNHVTEQMPGATWLVEQYVAGIEYGLDGLISNGTARVFCIRRKEVTTLPFRQVMTYTFDPDEHERLLRTVTDEMQGCIRALGATDGCFHADILELKDGSILVLEASLRLGGLLTTERIVPKATGIDFIQLAIGITAGIEAQEQTPRLTPVHLRFLDLPPGLVCDVPSLPPITNGEAHLAATPGTVLKAVSCGADVLARGWVMGFGGDVPTLMRRIGQVAKEIESGHIIRRLDERSVEQGSLGGGVGQKQDALP